jgi:hypothetical protein
MSNNPFLQVRDQGYTNGASNGEVNSGNVVNIAHRKSMGELRDEVQLNGHFKTHNGVHENDEESDEHFNQTLPQGYAAHQQDGSGPQLFDDALPVQPSNGNYSNLFSDTFQGLQLRDGQSQGTTQSRHAHIPSISQIRKESLPDPRPIYTRALSSHVAESVTPHITPGDAHAEALRRLGKAERTVKTLKRRGSNESLSSLISYSIRRPSISATPKASGYSLDALAHVLEEAAQEGNLVLVEAIMALGANPNFRSVNRIKNRRHDALNKATAAGHVEVIDYLLRQGATFDLGEGRKKDEFEPIDYKVLDVAYSGYGEVARYLIEEQSANAFVVQWPREYFDAKRTVYRRVVAARVHQRTVLDAVARMGNEETDTGLLKLIMTNSSFNPTAIASRIYADTPYDGDGTRMTQVTYHYSALSTFIKAGWADAVEAMLAINPDPSAYQIPDETISEEGQIPSTCINRHVWPAHALTKDTWLYHLSSALRILTLLISHNFNISTPQQTADDSAPRTPLSRCILANAPSGLDALLTVQPDLVRQEISFRLLLPSSEFQEYTAQPLAASLIQGSLDCARVLLKHGARPHDPAFNYRNVMLFAAGHGVSGILPDLIALAPEMVNEALDMAIKKVRPDAVNVLLQSSGRLEGLGLWDKVLGVDVAGRDEEVARRYERILDMVYERMGRERPSEEAVKRAVEMGNLVGVERLVSWGVVGREEVG